MLLRVSEIDVTAPSQVGTYWLNTRMGVSHELWRTGWENSAHWPVMDRGMSMVSQANMAVLGELRARREAVPRVKPRHFD
jgi:hypothetical protein